jgi:beta-ureidopropionase / N-carbamoyl-L-amino-acid hydrolase
MNRRHFLGAIASSAFAAPASARISSARLREHLEELSVFGRPAGGTFADGVSRVAFSDADMAGRAYVMKLMQEAGLKPRIDAAGNILARRAGSDPAAAPVLFGSHIDSVPNGGNFDGDLGSLAAIEVIQTLNDAGVPTRRPLEIVVWCNEEGVAFNNGLFGSRAAAGKIEAGEMNAVWNGMKKTDALRKVGGDPERLDEARRPTGSFHCYLELHIEQGGTLDQAGIPIGVVDGIVAIDRYDVEIRGFANHAGTTPMPERRDALVAASHLTVAVNEIVRREPGRQVGTVGHLTVTPNAPNVIPGAVRLIVELRDLDPRKIQRLAGEIRKRVQEIAAATKTEIEMRQISHHDEALATPEVQKAIEAGAQRLGHQFRHLPSGAGHDAQPMATLGPMGMIFIPSVSGISHSPKEFSRWEDCARGADVLLETVLERAR